VKRHWLAIGAGVVLVGAIGLMLWSSSSASASETPQSPGLPQLDTSIPLNLGNVGAFLRATGQ